MFKKLALLLGLIATAAIAAPRVGHYDQVDLEGTGFITHLLSGATSTFSLTLPVNGGSSGQVLRTNGSGVTSWVTPSAGSVTSVATGTGLTGGPITGSGTIAVSLIPIANGGTNATSAGAALTNLGAAASGANSDITSLSGLTTPLSIAQGGTSAITAAAARAALSAAALGANSDIMSLSGLTTPLSIAQGGTGQITALAAFEALSPITTRGDLVTRDATNEVRLAIGSAATFLRSNGTDPSWATVTLSTDVSGTLPIGNGGTGQTTAIAAFNGLSPITTRGDLVTNDGTNDVRLAVGAASRVLRSNGTDPSWAQVTLTTDVTGTLPIANGGTGQTTQAAAFNALDPITTKGDLIAHDGTNSVRVAVGSNTQVLTADSSAASGVSWQTPATSTVDPFAIIYMKDDFPTTTDVDGIGELGWTEESAGTAATTIRKNGISGHPGIISLRPGTVATGRAAIAFGANGVNNEVLGDGITVVTFLIRSAALLAQLEQITVGLGDVSNAVGDQANGIYFRAQTLDTNWFLVGAAASSRTANNTSTAYAANTWIKLKITCNAAGTSCQGNINGSDVGSPVTTNLPTSAISPIVKVDGIAAGVASDTDIDVFEYRKTLTTPR